MNETIVVLIQRKTCAKTDTANKLVITVSFESEYSLINIYKADICNTEHFTACNDRLILIEVQLGDVKKWIFRYTTV